MVRLRTGTLANSDWREHKHLRNLKKGAYIYTIYNTRAILRVLRACEGIKAHSK